MAFLQSKAVIQNLSLLPSSAQSWKTIQKSQLAHQLLTKFSVIATRITIVVVNTVTTIFKIILLIIIVIFIIIVTVIAVMVIYASQIKLISFSDFNHYSWSFEIESWIQKLGSVCFQQKLNLLIQDLNFCFKESHFQLIA